MNKQIYAALEISDVEVRILVGEFLNGRLNLLRQESVFNNAVNNFKIINKELLKQNIKKLIDNVSKNLEFSIERVILLLPPYRFKRKNLRIEIETETGIIKYSDVGSAINLAMSKEKDDTLIVVNTVCNRYIVNDIGYRKLPIKEKAKSFIVDLDFLMIDKQLAYDYVMLLEEIGISILDICLDMFAVCKEASLFEKTIDQNIILIKGDYQTISLGLISKGQLMQCEILEFGIGNLIDKIAKNFKINSSQRMDKLLKYGIEIDETKWSNRLLYLENYNYDKSGITVETLSKTMIPFIQNYVEKIIETCQPILDSGLTTIELTGEIAKIISFSELLKKHLKNELKIYIPETIGARDSKFTSLLGSMYAFKDMVDIKQNKLLSINLDEYEQLINGLINDKETISLTSKISSWLGKEK